MLFRCKWIVVILILTSLSWGNRIGNGGTVVSCPKETQILDFYESKMPISFKGSTGAKDYKDVSKDVFKRLETISGKLSVQYLERLETIHHEIEFLKNVALTNLNDSLHLFKPSDKNCQVKQIAIRKEISLPSDKRFLIDIKLWDRLDTQNKAGLLVHEVIYEHFNKLGETSSVKVRKVVAYLFQEDVIKKDFWNLIKTLKLPIYPD